MQRAGSAPSLARHLLTAVSIRSSSGWRSFARAASTSFTPLRQVSIMKATRAASSSGNQPPSNSLIELAEKKITSITKKKPLTATTIHGE